MDARRRARLGTGLGFFVTGLLSATWASRIPAVQERLDLGSGGLAVVVLGIEGGALVGLPLGTAVVARAGSRTALKAGLAVYAPGLVAATVAPGLGGLLAAVAVWAAANSVLDVALNTQGVELDRRTGRSGLSALHAWQSAGLVVGAGVGTAAAASGVPLPWHACAVGGSGLALGLLGARWSARGPARGVGPAFARPGRSVVLLGTMGFCAFLVDGAAMNWIAVHLDTTHGAGAGLAAAGYLGLTVAMAVGRLPADRLVERLSRRRLAECCALGIAVGTVVLALAPSAAVAVAGWLAVGLALGPLAPIILGAAPLVGSVPPATAIAAVATPGYLGSFTGPPVIGLLADLWSLPAALTVLLGAALAVGLLARSALGRT